MSGFGRLVRNIGNRPTGPAAQRAIDTAVGANRPKRIVRHSGNGSSAGLNASPTARLEHNGSGYPTSRNNLTKQRREFKLDFPSGGIYLPDKGSVKFNDLTSPKYLV